jgi:ribonuclease HI
MTDISDRLPSPNPAADTAESTAGLQLFADGCYEPDSGQGGWAFVAYRDGVEIASGCGGVADTANNAMEALALLEAVSWINANALDEAATVWTDSVHAVKGCNDWRHIWKTNGWKRIVANKKARNRGIADHALWQALDRQLSDNGHVTISWCKGHAGIDGNERADRLADSGRLSMQER